MHANENVVYYRQFRNKDIENFKSILVKDRKCLSLLKQELSVHYGYIIRHMGSKMSQVQNKLLVKTCKQTNEQNRGRGRDEGRERWGAGITKWMHTSYITTVLLSEQLKLKSSPLITITPLFLSAQTMTKGV